MVPDEESEITLYQDPTLTLGPAIVHGIIGQFVDGFAGIKIATGVLIEQLKAREVELDGLTLRDAIMEYATWAAETGAGQASGTSGLLDIQPPQTGRQANDSRNSATTLTMTSMMIFYLFFTGAATAQTIIREEEEGTLQRLFTTPTAISTLLAGKFTASVFTLSVQVGILMLASAILFGIEWGAPLPTLLIALATVLVAAGFGMFLMSLLKSSRQVGIVYGGVMTVTGMLGGLFTSSIPGVPHVFHTLSLSMPQGWALRGWKETLAGGGVADVLLPAAVMLLVAGAFLAIGIARFRRRFA
jgi:ABC-2 type transport system permease protein